MHWELERRIKRYLKLMNSNHTVWIARHSNRLDFVNQEWFNTAEHT
jgi:hypothetical protein